MSVIFSVAITGLGHIAHAVALAAEKMPMPTSEFELSQDGETVWDNGAEYTFVGFSEDDDFSRAVGKSRVSVGRRLGRVKYEPDCGVWQLRTVRGDYIMLRNRTNTAEIFKRIS